IGVLFAAGAAFVSIAATQRAASRRAGDLGDAVPETVAISLAAQAPTAAPAPPAPNNRRVVIQAEVVDQDGRRLFGAEILVNMRYSGGAQEQESMFERTRSDGEGHIRIELARDLPDARLYSADVWAYQPGRALATSAVYLGADTPPPVIKLTVAQPSIR